MSSPLTEVAHNRLNLRTIEIKLRHFTAGKNFIGIF